MKSSPAKKSLSSAQTEALLALLEQRFAKHPQRHAGLAWAKVRARLAANPASCWSLQEMEDTGGEPDVISHDPKTGSVLFVDCAPQSPKGRTSLCYDRAAWDSRKEHKPKSNIVDLAAAMGVEILTEAEYHSLQQLGEFDTKSSTWLKTPPEIRQLGGAIFGDRRFGRVFIYHNGAESYYSGRGFRASLRV